MYCVDNDGNKIPGSDFSSGNKDCTKGSYQLIHFSILILQSSSIKTIIYVDQSAIKNTIYVDQSAIKNTLYVDQSAIKNTLYVDQSAIKDHNSAFTKQI